MARPVDRSELLERIDADFERLLAEVDVVPPEHRHRPGACDEWSVTDLLAHLDAWHRMFLEWERVGRTGEIPEMPAPGYGWGDTPALNDEIWRRHRGEEHGDVRERLEASHAEVREVVASYGDEDLFAKRRYRWTGTTSVGSYAVSATTSHYDWARRLIRRHLRGLAT